VEAELAHQKLADGVDQLISAIQKDQSKQKLAEFKIPPNLAAYLKDPNLDTKQFMKKLSDIRQDSTQESRTVPDESVQVANLSEDVASPNTKD
jgi:hypothetical protein